ncbi:MAG: germination protein YpeB [Oscillospiraceae bacterium]
MKKSTAITIISILAVIAVAAGTFSVLTIRHAAQNERYISANYRHAFSELVSGISEMDSALQKSLLVTSPSMAGAVCTEVFGNAQMAQMALGVLPFSATELERTSGFIGRVGDYAFSLSQKAASGEAFSPEERESLRSLSDTATLLSQNLRAMQDELGNSDKGMKDFQRSLKHFDENEGKILPQTLGDSMGAAENEFPEIPALIYDGPFSEHLKNIEPRLLEGREEITEPEGRKIVAQFLGNRAEQVYPTGECKGHIPSFCYGTEIDEVPVSVTVSKKGGVVYEVLASRAVERTELGPKEAISLAKKYLERRGYTNMTESYYLISDNIMTANFAWMQGEVVCYSDLIKVGISMDTGSIQSFEASGYITAHAERELPEIAVSAEEAQSHVAEGLEILGVRTALIPDAGKKEILCYEFECRDASDSRYIIYVNAVSGEQEKILILLQDENGTLTI